MALPVTTPDDLRRIQAFLDRVGIVMTQTPDPVEGFLPGVRIVHGGLLVGPGADADSILHEAGHLATTPAPFRDLMHGNVTGGQKKMADALLAGVLDPECDLVVQAMQCSDAEASAWAFAAGRAIGLPDDKIILDSSFDGGGASIRQALALSAYLGINGMVRAGMCAQGLYARMKGLPAYPEMIRWTQEGPYPELGAVPVEPARKTLKR
jgi:hypothetical protein